MKRFFKRKKLPHSANDEQATGASNSAPPSVGSIKDSIGVAASVRSNASGSQPSKNGAISYPIPSSVLQSKSLVTEAELAPRPPQSSQTTTTISSKASSAASNVLKEATQTTEAKKKGAEITIQQDEGMQSADTDSDDAGLLPSERAEYKGVSQLFRDVNATEQFADENGDVDPDGRLAGISDAYDSIPLIEQTKLPRGGISMETKAIGRIQVRGLLMPDAPKTFQGSSNALLLPLNYSLVFPLKQSRTV